jgi:hypothetical protein
MSKHPQDSGLIAKGVLNVPEWNCEIPFTVRRIKLTGKKQLICRDADESDQQQLAGDNTAFGFALTNAIPQKSPRSKQKGGHRGSAKQGICRSRKCASRVREARESPRFSRQVPSSST